MLPKNLKYGSKVESAAARSMRTNIAPQNGTGTYGLGDTIIINIPTRNNLVLCPQNSYLKFKLGISNLVANNAYRFDSCGAHGIIQRIRVFHGSNLLEDQDSYGMLAKLLFDMQMPPDSAYGKMTLLAGTRSDTVGFTGALAGSPMSVYQVNSGERIGGTGNDVNAVNLIAVANPVGSTSVSDTYCLNLISLVGSLCSSSYIPLFGMTSAPLRVEIQLVDVLYKGLSSLTSTGSANAGTLQISNCEYVADFIELGDSAMQIINSSLEGGPLQFVFPSFRNYQFTFALANGTSTQVAMPIPAKFSSLKAILVSCRDQGTGAPGGYFPFSSVVNGLTDYQFRVGSQIMPPKAPQGNTTNAPGTTEFFAEALKAMGTIGDINYCPSIEKTSYSLNASTPSVETATAGSIVSSGSFYIGLDLENYSGAAKDTIFSGHNSNTDDIFLIANFTAPAAIAACRFDAFANYDAVIVCENSTAYLKF